MEAMEGTAEMGLPADAMWEQGATPVAAAMGIGLATAGMAVRAALEEMGERLPSRCLRVVLEPQRQTPQGSGA